jgi:hypothetical protein
MKTRNKKSSDVTKRDFWSHYNKSVEKPVDRKVFDKVFSEIFKGMSESITRDATSMSLTRLGSVRIRAIKPKLLDENGNFRKGKLKVDWAKTWKYWRQKYEGKTDEEIKKITDKQMFYHMNEHSNGYTYEAYWDKVTCLVKGKSYYKFKFNRTYNRLRADLILNHGMVYYE